MGGAFKPGTLLKLMRREDGVVWVRQLNGDVPGLAEELLDQAEAQGLEPADLKAEVRKAAAVEGGDGRIVSGGINHDRAVDSDPVRPVGRRGHQEPVVELDRPRGGGTEQLSEDEAKRINAAMACGGGTEQMSEEEAAKV